MGMRTSHDSIFTKSEVPGPGTYQPVNVTHTSAKFTLKGKHKIGTLIVITPDGGHEKMTQSCDFNVPGPGTYSAKTSQIYTNLSTKFGCEQRPSMG
jgi:DNA integrity scanning protein DisA with diadenylate cyclase activity